MSDFLGTYSPKSNDSSSTLKGGSMEKNNGGYFIKARCIQESEIAHAPPHIREIWDWLIQNAMWRDGKALERGQLLATYRDIQEGLCWFVGYRKMTYKNDECEKALKWLVKANMVTKTKTTRGLLITVLNYAKYQDFENYESQTEDHMRATMKPQRAATIEKETNTRNKGMKKEEQESAVPAKGFSEKQIEWIRNIPEEDRQELMAKYRIESSTLHACAEDVIDYCEAKGKTYKNYKAALRNFIKSHIERHPEAIRKQSSPAEIEKQEEESRPRTPEEQARIDVRLAELKKQRENLAQKANIKS